LTCLDSNIVIYCLKGREPWVSRFRALNPADSAIPSVVGYELEYGTLKVSGAARRRALSAMLGRMRELPFDREASRAAAAIRVDLERRGLTIGPLDLLIAGTVVCHGATLVTHNVREFGRIKGLRLENWGGA
jgi:tRNA(fMet)-specific endonuclease VapC